MQMRDGLDMRRQTVGQQREAFASLVRLHQSSLLRIGIQLCRGDETCAQDLVQESLVKGYRLYLAGGLAEGSNARAWLARILTNLFLSDYRKRRKEREAVSLDEALLPDVTGETDRRMLSSVLDEPLELALRRLPENQRLCTVLIDIEGLDYAEAAQVLECPVGTIRSRLARARAALYADLLEYAQDRGAI